MHTGSTSPQLRLRELRTKQNKSQVRLAADAGVALTTISIAERTGFLSRRSAERIASALGVTAGELLAEAQ